MPVQYHYKNFPPTSLNWESLIPIIGPTHAAIARFDALLKAMPNADILLSPLMTREAVLSSRIEGTQATMSEVLEYEATGDTGKFDDLHKADFQEIMNYRSAMHDAEIQLQSLPLSQRLLRNVHAILLSGVRGQNKAPGEYRKIANWIGPPGCTMEKAHYIPISADKLAKGMDIWEKFIHAEYQDSLVKLALLHLEFEALHPFLDGNGRLGRIFIPLFLWQQQIISRPTFYVSSVFEQDKEEYYRKLRAVSENGSWTEWCQYFLKSLHAQADENMTKAKKILDLYDKMKHLVPSILNTQYFMLAVDWIFNFPLFSGSKFVKKSGIPNATARRILPLLVNAKVIKIIQPGHGRRPAIYNFPALLNIAEGREIF